MESKGIVAPVLAGLVVASTAWGRDVSRAQVEAFRSKIQHIVVIYQENWSFDGLYGRFPGADGIVNARGEGLVQKGKDGKPLATAPMPVNEGKPDPNFADVDSSTFLKPYDLSTYIKPDVKTGDLVHRFYTNQLQINGGRNDKFVAWSDNGGLTMSHFDATNMPEGRLAREYVLFDRFFQGAFGGSFLNHQFLIAATPPVFANAPADMIATPPDAAGLNVADKVVTPDDYVVNTAYSVNQPVPAWVKDKATLVPSQTHATIGDRLSERGISWAWYSGGWDEAMAGKPDPLFQFHHQPFVYFERYKDGTKAKATYLKDEKDFLKALESGDVPAVAFVKPIGADNEHPGYSNLQQGQQHVADLVEKIQKSPIWKDTAIIITYDEFGGRWDHVAPPVVDRWGPGTRIPAILVSPFAKRKTVDHGTYDTTSILKLIETRWGLEPLNARDAKAGDLLHAFAFK